MLSRSVPENRAASCVHHSQYSRTRRLLLLRTCGINVLKILVSRIPSMQRALLTIRERKSCMPIVLTSIPSTTILPSAASTNLNRLIANVLFPLPVRPSSPTRSPARRLNDTFLRTSGSSAAYLTVKFRTCNQDDAVAGFVVEGQ